MSMDSPVLTRQGFLRIGAAWLGAITLPLGLGCPADDGDDEGADSGTGSNDDATTAADGESTAAAASCEMDPSATISANHGHAVTLPLADVMAGAGADYDIQGTADHPHTLSLSDEHLAMLQQGMQVTVASSTDAGHNHQVTLDCS
jgi:hypothetical protein